MLWTRAVRRAPMTPLRLVLAGAAGSAAADFGDQGHLAYRRTIYRRTDRLTDGGKEIRTLGPADQVLSGAASVQLDFFCSASHSMAASPVHRPPLLRAGVTTAPSACASSGAYPSGRAAAGAASLPDRPASFRSVLCHSTVTSCRHRNPSEHGMLWRCPTMVHRRSPVADKSILYLRQTIG
jgi:hypothetical protein